MRRLVRTSKQLGRVAWMLRLIHVSPRVSAEISKSGGLTYYRPLQDLMQA